MWLDIADGLSNGRLDECDESRAGDIEAFVENSIRRMIEDKWIEYWRLRSEMNSNLRTLDQLVGQALLQAHELPEVQSVLRLRVFDRIGSTVPCARCGSAVILQRGGLGECTCGYSFNWLIRSTSAGS